DQRVRLLRTKITDKARDRARRPIDTEAVNADLWRKPGWRGIGAVTQHGRLNPAGLKEAKSKATDRVAVRSFAGAVNKESQADSHVQLHRSPSPKSASERTAAHELSPDPASLSNAPALRSAIGESRTRHHTRPFSRTL